MARETIDWSPARDLELVESAYMGLITEGIADRMGLKRGQVHGRLGFLGISLDKVRQWKREGKSTAEIMKWIEDRRAPGIPEKPHNTLADLIAHAIKQQGELMDTWGRVEAELKRAAANPQLSLIAEGNEHAAA